MSWSNNCPDLLGQLTTSAFKAELNFLRFCFIEHKINKVNLSVQFL